MEIVEVPSARARMRAQTGNSLYSGQQGYRFVKAMTCRLPPLTSHYHQVDRKQATRCSNRNSIVVPNAGREATSAVSF